MVVFQGSPALEGWGLEMALFSCVGDGGSGKIWGRFLQRCPGTEGVGEAGGAHGTLRVPIAVPSGRHRPLDLFRASHIKSVELFRISA